MEKPCILVVDDDREIVDAVAKLLKMEGYSVLKAYDGLQTVDILTSNEVHLIIIDIMMPNMDGLSTTIKIRESKNIPIILLSAKTEESDKVIGLTMGADDYIEKPYAPGELLARVKSQIRRYLSLGDYGNHFKKNVIQIGGLALDVTAKELSVDGEKVKLTPTEWGIMELLMSNPGCVFSAEEIYKRVWDEDAYSVDNTVMVHIRRIREKIEINPKEPKYLKVVWGIGYKMEKY